MKEIHLNATTKLRRLELTDAPDIYHAIDSQRNYLGKFLPFVDQTKSPADTNAFVQASVEMAQKTDEHTFIISSEESFAGLIGFKGLDKQNQRVEIGYWLCEQYQHRGIITLAVKHLCELAFIKMHMNRIQIRCAIHNLPSKHIPLRLGFSHEGIERAGEKMSDGTFTDIDVYSLLQFEMKNINKYKYE